MAHFDSLEGLLGGSPPYRAAYRSESDFYFEPDDVMRGLSLADVPPAASFGSFGFSIDDGLVRGVEDGPLKWHCAPPAFGGAHGQEEKSPARVPDEDLPRFSDGHRPRPVPTDAFFRLEATSLKVNGATPATVGNSILDVLRLDLDASITKVSPDKFALKASVFNRFGTCSLKIRMYEDGTGALTVELQRRSGNAMAFAEAFASTAEHLPGSAAPFAKPLRPPALEISSSMSLKPPSGCLEPLLDMAQDATSEELQAEAAVALLEAVRGSTSAAAVAEMVSARGLEVLEGLLMTSAWAVARPTMELLAAIVASGSKDLPSRPSLLAVVARKAVADNSDLKVQLGLAQALRRLVEKEDFSAAVKQQLRAALRAALQQHQGCAAAAMGELQAALILLGNN